MNDEVGSAAIEVPAWVQDAVFYQIFPGRFARSERVRNPRDRPGTRRRPGRVITAATCGEWSSTWTTWWTWASPRSI